MATRFMSKALLTAALGIALIPLLAATPAPSPAPSNPAAALQLDPPAAPSHLGTSSWYDRRERETYLTVNWTDNSSDEDGFVLEVWQRNESNAWVLAGSITEPANATGDGFIFSGRHSPYKFRVKAFNAAGESAWSNWAR
jgi:hypothetical protein